MTAQELAEKLMSAQRASRLAKHQRVWTPTATPATDLGLRCERRIVYHRCWPERAEPIGEELASIFEEGNLHQVDVRRELSALGFEVVEAERNFRDAKLEITGTIDGKIALSDEHRARRIPVEIKSTMLSPPETVEAWRNSENKLLAKYYAQLQTYLVLCSEPDGLGLFKNKATGLWGVVAVPLDYEYAEGLLKRAERVRDTVKSVMGSGSVPDEIMLPDRIMDRSECDGCPWRETMCHPADAAVDPLLLADDADLVSQIEERARCDESATRYDKIDKTIKDRFKLTKGTRFVVGGSWLVTKKPHGKGTRIDISRIGTLPETV
jgi:hypothetical protein